MNISRPEVQQEGPHCLAKSRRRRGGSTELLLQIMA